MFVSFHFELILSLWAGVLCLTFCGVTVVCSFGVFFHPNAEMDLYVPVKTGNNEGRSAWMLCN